ncbi:MAG: hypothetical protein E7670_06965 [Ruminococcaceae bacterium]|nr:hypothetical protein [Oscillospiraceae bacterium]
MNDYEGTRNFESVQPEGSKSPKNGKSDPKKKIAIAIFTIVIAIVLLFCAVIITKIVYKLNGDSDKTDGSGNNLSYKTVSIPSSDINNGTLLLVEDASDMKNNPEQLSSTASDSNGDPYYIGTGSYPKDKLTSDTVKALKAMAQGLYRSTEVRFVIGYAYDQNATGEECEHVLGTVVDIKQFGEMAEDNTISSTALNSDAINWLQKNCAKYGFIITVTHSDGSTQLRYVGVAHATYIVKNNISLSAYTNKLKDHSPEDTLSIEGADGKNYSVYYVKSTGDDTEVKVPQNYDYEISGNNTDGFIVTVNLSK